LETPGNLAITVRKAQDLSNLILAPIANRLNSDRLLVVPDGLLHQIPFSAIDTPNTQSYTPLLVNAEIVNAPSSSTIAINRDLMGDRPPAPKRLAVLADPVFTPDDPRVTGSGGERNLPVEIQRNLRAFDLRGIPRLPYTRKEAQQLLDLVPDDSEASVFDFQANYPWVTSDRLDRYQFVHFATHGFVNESNPELSGLILSLVDEQGRPQNGFLRLVDIFNLQMSAELVTLSACQTGLGDNVDGEGVIGLTRGLMYAGAERTLVSLWNVSDRQTATLMSRFYDGIWQDGLAPAAALRQAQLSMWEEGDHPYFWAAFGLQGEWQG
jgi:CHAT domain-containing protein